MNGSPKQRPNRALLAFVVVVAILYFAREFLIPIALAILVSFLLAPLIQRLERVGVPRGVSVVGSTLLALLFIVGFAFLVGSQVVDLAARLPNYQNNLSAKVEAFRGPNNSAIKRAVSSVKEVVESINKQVQQQETTQQGESSSGATPSQTRGPLPVSIVNSPGNPWQMVKSVAEPALAPLGTAALVLLLVIFLLLEREDMRDRIIHLIGRNRLQITTQALDEAGQRVSRYLLAQFAVNMSYGLLLAVGLYFIGIPNAPLWGMTAGVFRFVPYIGPWVGAAFPLLLSLAIAPGWTTPLETFGLFLVVELLCSNVLEPWLYGSSTGMSPLAVIAAAAFWTWLWGTIGLLLSTPITVCIAVIGKYIPSLSFLDVLLGDAPPIAQEDRLYQRLLAHDEDEVCELIEAHLKEHNVGETFDELVIPTLRLIDEDYLASTLTEADRCKLLEDLREIVGDVAENEAPKLVVQTDAPEQSEPVVCIPARDLGDEIGCVMLARLLAEEGVPSRVVSSKLLASETVEELEKLSSQRFCVSVIPPGSTRQAIYVCKRLRARFPAARIAVGMWGEPAGDDHRIARIRNAQFDVIFTSLRECTRELASSAPVREPVPETPTAAAPAAA